MYFEIFKGIILPFIGTSIGAACVFFIKNGLRKGFKSSVSGFAAGVMIAASVWSLLIPAMEYESAQNLGVFAFLPAVLGLWSGIAFLMIIDKLVPQAEFSANKIGSLGESKMMFWSVTLHNLPEGMAVGVAYAAFLSNGTTDAFSGALALSLGIAIQNLPEGAIISLPLAGEGIPKGKAFLYGVLSGIVEPIGAFLTVLAVSWILPILPILLGFAAGAMIYAVIKELMPIISKDENSYFGVLFFGAGFSFMMILDVVLG